MAELSPPDGRRSPKPYVVYCSGGGIGWLRIGSPKPLHLFTSVRPPTRPLGAIAEDLKPLGAIAIGRLKKIARKIGFLSCLRLSHKSQMTTMSI